MAVRSGNAMAGASRPAVARVVGRLASTPAVSALAGATLAVLIVTLAPGPPEAGALIAAGGVMLLLTTGTMLLTVFRLSRVNRSVATLREERAAFDAAASTVAHDIRSPLVTVHSYLELLSEEAFGPLPADARQAAERATRAAGRAQSLIEGTLRQHVVGAATRPVEAPAGVVDLAAVLADVIASLDAELASAGARVEVADLPAVAGDGGALYRIFCNLVQNAVKYAAPGSPPRVALSASIVEGRCEVAVRDWGIGIAAADRERVFEPHERGEAARGLPGEGMGLATVRQLVAAQGGTVWIDPDVSAGTCMRLSLPGA